MQKYGSAEQVAHLMPIRQTLRSALGNEIARDSPVGLPYTGPRIARLKPLRAQASRGGQERGRKHHTRRQNRSSAGLWVRPTYNLTNRFAAMRSARGSLHDFIGHSGIDTFNLRGHRSLLRRVRSIDQITALHIPSAVGVV